MFKKGLKLPIIFHSDETPQLKELGIPYPLTDCITRYCMFYNINCVIPYDDPKDKDENGKSRIYAQVHTNGDNFLTPYSMKELSDIIAKHIENERD